MFIFSKKEADEAAVSLHELKLEVAEDLHQQQQTVAENRTRATHLSSKKDRMDGQHATRRARLEDEARTRAGSAKAKYELVVAAP